MTGKSFAVAACLAVISNATVAWGSDESVHYALVAALAQNTGFTPQDAKLIADASQSLDDQLATTAFDFALIKQEASDLRQGVYKKEDLPHMCNGQVFHALTMHRTEVEELHLRRMRELSQERTTAANSGASPRHLEQLRQRELIYLGEYLHFVADEYVHPRNPLIGHAFKWTPPDRAQNNPDALQRQIAGLSEMLQAFRDGGAYGLQTTAPAENTGAPPKLSAIQDELKTALLNAWIPYLSKNVQPSEFFFDRDAQIAAMGASAVRQVLVRHGMNLAPHIAIAMDGSGEPLDVARYGQARSLMRLPLGDLAAQLPDLVKERQNLTRDWPIETLLARLIPSNVALPPQPADKICLNRLGEGTLPRLENTFHDATNALNEAANSANGPAPARAWARAQARQTTASWNAHLLQARQFQQQALHEDEAARTAQDPAEQQRHLNREMQTLDKRDGLNATMAQELRRAANALNGQRPGPRHVPLHFDSPEFDLLKKMSEGPAVAAAAFDGSSQRAFVEAGRGVATQTFTLPAASGPQKQPGGIKFSVARAEQLASALDVTSIDFDPIHGRIVLAGPKMRSGEAFDLEVFADVLRLAGERYEPFFSLDPSDPADWDRSLERISEALSKKYRPEEVARRVRALCPSGIQRGNITYYYTTVEVLDGDLAAEANAGRDLSVKLVYSPDWLRYSKVGAILFDADLAIKAVASGFLERDGAIEPAFAWQLGDFRPEWLQAGEGKAGRANFELAHALVRNSGNRLDLAEIHPGLYVTERRAGTDQDLAPSANDRHITQYFDAHWRDFVENVPEIARLEMVFRAYVAARFLTEHHPGLAARIRNMPPTQVPQQPPLRIVNPSVIRVAFEGDRPVSLVAGQRVLYELSGGYGGGINLSVDGQGGKAPAVQEQYVPADPGDWVRQLRAAVEYGDVGYSESNERAAAVLEFDSFGLPLRWHLRIIGAVAAVLLLIGGLSLALRHFDWQRITVLPACRHCARVHRRIGRLALPLSAVTAGGIMYLALLIITAATDVWSGPQLWAAAAVPAALIVTFMVLGLIARAMTGVISRAPQNRGPGTALFSGAHFGCAVLAIFLFHGGFSAGTLGGNLSRVLGPTVAERVFARLGGIAPLANAILVAAAATVLVVLLRWAAPYLFSSRPLPLLRFSPHAQPADHS